MVKEIKCVECGGNIFEAYNIGGNLYSCVNCGELVVIPAEERLND